jgi:glycosyltransferase involved in cell wall biosynthesis
MNHNQNKPRVAISHICMRRGGSEAAAMWAIQALKDDYNVTLLTAGEVSLQELNDYYGTRVATSEFHVLRYVWPRCLRLGRGLDALRGALFERFCRRVAGQFDVLFSAYNPYDYGVPAIHRVADFCWDPMLIRDLARSASCDSESPPEPSWLRSAYWRIARRYGRPSGRDLFAGDDLMLANSAWTAGLLKDRHGARKVHVLHPPVACHIGTNVSSMREPGFVCLGRIVPEKKLERIIDILARVRARGHDLRLYVVGEITATPYAQRISKLCHENNHWICVTGQLAGNAKRDLLSRQAFGIHARIDEAFGIAVAEMVQAGMIPFVHSQGGPAEIVARPELLYSDAEDAVEKIDRVLRNPRQQRELEQHVRRQGERFSTNAYMSGVRRVVGDFLSDRARLAA